MQHTSFHSPFYCTRRRVLRAGVGLATLGAMPTVLSSQAQTPAPVTELCRTRRFESVLPTGLQGEYARITPLRAGMAVHAIEAPALAHADAPRLAAGYAVNARVNPVLVADAQTHATLTLRNTLAARATSWHWHGVHLPEADDGVFTRSDAGHARRVRLALPTRACTAWLHPHPHGSTAQQTFEGLACPLIVRDAQEKSLGKQLELALGINDVTLMLQDARYGQDGRVVYAPRAGEAYEGVFGACVAVNGVDAPLWRAPAGWLRMRIINAANARVFKLGVRQGATWHAMQVIGVDQGLLAAPVAQRHVFLAPGQRLDVLLDPRAWQADAPAFLASDGFDPMHGRANAHTMSGLPHGTAMALLQIKAPRSVAALPPLPAQLDERAQWQGALPTQERDFTLTTTGALWRMNGKTYRADEVPIEVARGAREVWSFNNSQRGMPHPMHLHGFAFAVLQRKDGPDQVRALALDAQGRLANDLGMNDTVLVWPGETVRIAVDFAHSFSQAQRYVVHCHNLEHEDGGLMLNFSVGA